MHGQPLQGRKGKILGNQVLLALEPGTVVQEIVIV